MHGIVYTSIFAQYNPRSIDKFTFAPLMFVNSVQEIDVMAFDHMTSHFQVF
jgi:hypothetical protein